MAIILYKQHVDAFEFPYPQTVIDVFPDSQAKEVRDFVDNYNNSQRFSTWDIKLGCRSDKTVEVDPTHKEISFK